MKILVSVLFLFCFSLAESKSFLDNKLRNAATDDLYNNDDSYEYEYEYEDIDEGNMFECLDGSGSKVILDYMCNGYRDCEDGSDEDIVNCAVHGITVTKTSTTSTTTTTTIPPPTTTSTTIKSLKIKEPDEFDDYEDACSTDEFQCKSDLGICLPKALVCDGTHDCPNGEDETDCPTGKGAIKVNETKEVFTPTYNVQSSTSQSPAANLCSSLRIFQCRSRPGDCVPKFLLCDGFRDCEDGSDEERCTCRDGEFRCLNRKCIKAYRRCNGVNDCGDFSDEIIGCMIAPPSADKELQTSIAQQNITTAGTENHATTPSPNSSTLSATTGEELKTIESRTTIHTNKHTDSSKTPNCQNKWRFCSLEPCANRGKCYENENSFVCVCTENYSGPTCMQRRSKDLNKKVGNGSVSLFSEGLPSITSLCLSILFFLKISL